MTTHELRNYERQAWRDYSGYIRDWIRRRNHPGNWIFGGDERSHALWRIWRAAREALMAVSWHGRKR